MNIKLRRVLYWTPRLLGIVFVLFLSVFALDVFSKNQGFWDTFIALLIHLVPVYLGAVTLVIAWRWEWVGAILFTILALLYLVWSWGRFHWIAPLVISGTLVLLAVLFLLNWIYKDQLRKR